MLRRLLRSISRRANPVALTVVPMGRPIERAADEEEVRESGRLGCRELGDSGTRGLGARRCAVNAPGGVWEVDVGGSDRRHKSSGHRTTVDNRWRPALYQSDMGLRSEDSGSLACIADPVSTRRFPPH